MCKSFLFHCISLSFYFSFSLFSLFLLSSSILSSSPLRFSASYTDIKINTVCVWLVHRMHRHYRMHWPRMYDPPPPTFAPTIIPRHIHPSYNPPPLPPLADAHENCSCSVLQPTWLRGWVKVRTVKGEMKGLEEFDVESRIALENDEGFDIINDPIDVPSSASSTKVLNF